MAKSSASVLATKSSGGGTPGSSASAKAPTPVTGAAESVSFTPAVGGLVSETRTKQKGVSRGYGDSYKTSTTIHPNIEHAVNHLKATMGHAYSGDSGGDEKD